METPIAVWQIVLGLITGGVLVAILNRLFTRADVHRTESAAVTVRQIDDAAEMRDQLIKKAAKLEAEREAANQLLINGLQEEVGRMRQQFNKFSAALDASNQREIALREELQRVSVLQAERIENESQIRIENERLQAEIRELKESIRSSIEFYETELTKKEREIANLKDESERQSKAIAKMQAVLQQHQIVLDEHEHDS